MEAIHTFLEMRREQLLKIIAEKQNALSHAPVGKLRLCYTKNGIQYYHRTNPKDFNGTYIPKHNFALVQKLAQKDYDTKILRSCEDELLVIQKYLSSYPAKTAEKIHETLRLERRQLIVPIQESDEEYVQRWMSVEYAGKNFYTSQPEYYTAKGERVRSKSEIIIADSLAREGVPYKYECPLYLNTLGTVYPDFSVLNVKQRKELYWEHLGMMDDPQYAEYAIQKLAAYELNGILPGDNLILTFETKQTPLNQKLIKQMIEKYLH